MAAVQTLQILPPQNWQLPVVGAGDLNAVARDPQLQAAADGAVLRVIYGRVRLGAQVANVLAHNGNWIMQCVWGEGPVDAVETLTFGEALPPAGVEVRHYLGGASQAVDSWLVDAFAAAGRTYADALPGVAYSVLKVPASLLSSVPSVMATVRGRLLLDPRTGTTVWRANPALALADFLGSNLYGAGRPVNADSVKAVADACDALVGGKARRGFGLVIDQAQPIASWIDALRAYAGCWVVDVGGEQVLVPDRPGSVAMAFDHAQGQIADLSGLRMRGVAQSPTVVEIRYTDTTALPWREQSAWAFAPGVQEGAVSRRVSQVAMPGIQDAAQAQREAEERLAKLLNADRSCTLDVFDEAAVLTVGDIVSVTHPIGLAATQFRVLGRDGGYGRYRLSLAEYSSSAYSNATAAMVAFVVAPLPSPLDPPAAVSGLTLVEELYSARDGSVASRLRVTWAAPTDQWRLRFAVEVTTGGARVGSGFTDAGEFVVGPLEDGRDYRVTVRSERVGLGVQSAERVATISAQGKRLPPTNVQGLQAVVTTTGLVLSWYPAIDIDLEGYRVRQGAAWATATQLAEQAATTISLGFLAPGSRAFRVRAFDRSGNESLADAVLTHVVPDVPAPVGLVVRFVGADLVLEWQAPTHLWPIVEYEVREGAAWASASVVGRFKATSVVRPAIWSGTRTYWVAAVDASGAMGAPAAANSQIQAPARPSLQQQVVDNNVQLYWQCAQGTLPIRAFDVARGADEASLVQIGEKSGGFTTVFETQAGRYTYWVRARDAAGNVGEWGSVTAQVAQPPDYKLNVDWRSSWGGTKTNAVPDVDGSLVIGMASAETFEAHFTSRSWAGPQAQVDAGFPFFAQPAVGGQYEETFDYGALLTATRVTVNITGAWIGSPGVMRCDLFVSAATNGPWIQYADTMSVYATAFRYVRVRITVSTGMYDARGLQVLLDSKQVSDSGMVWCNAADAGGTRVLFGIPFLDVTSIQVTPQGTSLRTAIYDFVDTPSPTEMRVLLFDAAGQRVSGGVSYTVDGY